MLRTSEPRHEVLPGPLAPSTEVFHTTKSEQLCRLTITRDRGRPEAAMPWLIHVMGLQPAEAAVNAEYPPQ